ncbi:CRE-GRL-13 protein [Caenorhabditis remanei]|uniref:CRE-GRL-13 protein n=1 Tax=Caenorhabditis remanei TaxID=31234 RepID=E3LKR6_CAERE|nr:CRE-GRL-13 protein [Caenorhabditis remanei]
MVHILILSMTLFGFSHCLFFNGGGGCGCRPQQCGCAAPLPVARSYCPPSPCGRPFQPYQSYPPVSFRPPPPTIFQQQPQFYAVSQSQPIPIQTQFHNSYQQTPVFTSNQSEVFFSKFKFSGSYNAPFNTVPSYMSAPQNSPIQVTSAKETPVDTFDTVIQKSRTDTSPVKNDLDVDVIENNNNPQNFQNALSNFETSLQAYKSMNGIRGIRRAQGSKTEKPEKCSSARLQQIMEESMTSNVSVSKLRISQGAKKEFGYNFDVVCSQFDFSYLISSNIFCRVELDGQICLAYEN